MKIFVARQPILDLNEQLYGYEFLYRDNDENFFRSNIDGNIATISLISTLSTEFDLKQLTGGRYAFINFTEEILRSETLNLNLISNIPPDTIIIEILETVQPDPYILAGLKKLKEKGYLFALDDYTGDPTILMDIADMIKVDFRLTSKETQEKIAREYGDKILLAEKIESKEEFIQARNMNYQLFQGYYFSKPVVLSTDVVQIALSSYLKLWNEMNQSEINFERIEKIIRLDVNLSFKLMDKVNSLKYYRGNYVASIKEALVILGVVELKRWMLLLLLRDCFGENANLFAKLALKRAIFLEQVVSLLPYDNLQDDAYIVGLFSNIDIVTNRQLENILEKLYLSKVAKDALLGHPGLLSDLLYFTKQYEEGCWDSVDILLLKNNLSPETISTIYMQAITLAEQEFS